MTDTATTFGCDRCGHARDAHIGERLECPDRGQFSHAMWQESNWGKDDGHKLGLVLRWGEPHPQIVHPEGGCSSLVVCGHCREDAYEDPKDDCPKCHGSGTDPSNECWLDHFIGEVGREFFEMTPWAVETPFLGPIPILWRGDWDDFSWRPRDATASDEKQERKENPCQ